MSKREKILINKLKADQISIDKIESPSGEATSHDDFKELFKDPITEDDDKSAATVSKSLGVISIDYHVLFHPSYQVPTLFFIAHTGKLSINIILRFRAIFFADQSRLLPIEEVSRIFVNEHCSDEAINTISQKEHPILLRPYFTFHPCKL